MQTAPEKFTFDLDMSANAQAKSRVLTEDKIAEMLDAARAEGYAQGLEAGQNSVISQSAKDVTAASQIIAQTANQLVGQADASEKNLRAMSVSLAKSVGRKLAGSLLEREPEAELKGLLQDCLSSIESAPHLVIRCNPALADKLQELSEPLIAAAGFTGRLIVVGEPEIGMSDGRMEWADGGIVRDSKKISAQIDRSIQTYFSANDLEPSLLDYVEPPRPEPETQPEAQS